jgi:hypothetical protein
MNFNRWIMAIVIVMAGVAVSIDHFRYRPSGDSGHIMDEDEEAPCTMGGRHAEEEDDDEL